MRRVVRSIDPDMPVFDARTMQNFYTQRAVTTANCVLAVVGAMGLMGLALASIGLYGLVAYSVSRRTREIGIRMALGADRRTVVWMVLRQGLWLGGIGVSVGLAVNVLAGYLIASNMPTFILSSVDPLIYVAIPLVLLAITMLASWAPARRATLVDPLTSLRDE